MMNKFATFERFEKHLLQEKILIDIENRDYCENKRNYDVNTKTIVVKNVVGGHEACGYYRCNAIEPDKNPTMISNIFQEILIECRAEFPYFLFLKLIRDKSFIKFDTQRIDTNYNGRGLDYIDYEVQKCSLIDIYKVITDHFNNKTMTTLF